MFVDVARIWYRHKVLDAYQKELAGHLPVKLENNGGVSIYKMVLLHSEVLLFLYRVQS
jgi:hypothetical protein